MKPSHGLLASVVLLLGACRSNDLGSGLNSVERGYMMPVDKVWSASAKCAKDTGLTVVSDRHDALGGELVANRANDREVRMIIENLDDKHVLVTVRVEPGDVFLATTLQERIAANLGLAEAKGGYFGGNSLEAQYACGAERCHAAARKTYRAMNLPVTGEDSQPSRIDVDARTEQSLPLRIRIDIQEGDRCKVTFLAGASKSDSTKALVQQMLEEFDRALGSAK